MLGTVEQMLMLNNLVGLGTLIVEVLCVLILLDLIRGGKIATQFFHPEFIKRIHDKYFTSKNVLWLVFLASTASSIMTLIYSEIFGQIPCALCWFQRVFMYGIVVISATALYATRKVAPALAFTSATSYKEGELRGILKYILNFSILGAFFGLYQHIMQISALYGTHLPCPASGEDCSKMTYFAFGHITFPWSAFVFFVFFILIILYFRNHKSLKQ